MAAKDSDLAAFLARGDFTSPALFLFGSNADFVDSAATEVIDRVRKSRPDLSGVERFSADGLNAAPATVIDFFNERPLFGDHRFLAVTGVTERQSSYIDPLFQSGPPEMGPMLLLCSNSLTSKSKLLGAARDSGFCTMIRAYEAEFTRSELSERLAELGVDTVEPSALDLAHRRLASEDLATRTQTMRMLALYARNGRLSAEDLDACLPPGEDQLAGELLAALLSSDLRAVVAWRRRGAAEGAEPIGQLSILARALSEARRARLAATGQASGPPVFWKTDKIVKDAARRIRDIDMKLDRAISMVHQLERSARSSEGLIQERTERLLIVLARGLR